MVELDKVVLDSLEFSARIGTTEQERAKPQRLAVTVHLGCDLSRAGRSGELSDTVCYATLRERVLELSNAKQWVLIEELGEAICQIAFELSPVVQSTWLRVQKFVFEDTAWVGIEIQRQRK